MHYVLLSQGHKVLSAPTIALVMYQQQLLLAASCPGNHCPKGYFTQQGLFL